MTKKMKKMSKIIVAFTIVLAMVLAYFSPIANVVAATYGSGDYHVNLEFYKGDFTIDTVKVNGHTWASVSDEFRSNENQFTIEIFVYDQEEHHPNISYCGGECGSHYHIESHLASNGGVYVYEITVTDIDQSMISLSLVDGPAMGEQPVSNFDGKAYVLWSCGGGVCYHYFDNIPDFDEGMSTFYKDTTVTADNKDGSAEYKGWYTKSGFEDWVADYELATGHTVDWNTLDPRVILGEPEQNVGQYEGGAIASGCVRPAEGAHWSEQIVFEECVNHYAATQGKIWTRQLKPVGEPQYPNAYVSYGDRQFKVVIYNSNYRGVQMGDLSQLHYYPEEWTNPFIMRDQFDISGTTKAKPSPVTSILLEDTVMIKAINVNNFVIASIEPLDVPEDAVTVTSENGEFRLVFSSNFYSNVVFKVTGTDGSVSYMTIKRFTIDAWIKYVDNHPVLAAEFYFDKNRSYDDFNLTAKIVYKDGTSKNVKLEAFYGIDDGLGNIANAFEVESGKGLKKSEFRYTLDDDEESKISKIYMNAEYTGSTDDNYAGAYVGSGEGELANIYMGGEE